ncbi:MAG TPA: aminodeoxychorismate synthase component I [Terracidiphilus sp.]
MRARHPLPAAVYSLVEQTPGSVLLQTASPRAAHPISRLFCQPLRTVVATQPSDVPALLREIDAAVAEGLHAAGYFAYECGAAFEPSAGLPLAPADQPLAWFGLYSTCHRFDHRSGNWLDEPPAGLAECASDDVPDTCETIDAALPLSAGQYAERIAQIHEWIADGDVYQLNFTQPIQFQGPGSVAALYARLLRNQPAEYAAFLHTAPGRRVLSFSPELFFCVEQSGDQRIITTKPMKGTAPRGRTTAEDASIAAWLRNDEKNRSENVMIVDLLRNDLGRLCEFGSVRVDDLFAVERLPTLWQMTSTVRGTLRSDATYSSIVRALFPSGSVTGAPKLHAMQLLAQLEAGPRGVYTGAIGFFAPHQAVFNVAIRTLELDGSNGRMGVGSGVMFDSTAADEFRECQLKAEFLTRRSEPFQLIETMLWDGGFPLLPLHLDRLADSAAYFDFPCDLVIIRDALHAHAATLNPAHPYKVRLLLDESGSFHIASESIAPSVEPLRVTLAPQLVDSRNPMLFHKTTHRPLYAEALHAAQLAGFDEVLFFNQRGELTEGAISNVFIERNGELLTPPIACGLLAGIYRRHLLETHANAREQILARADLESADAIYLANAVRGLRRAVVTPPAST